MKGTQEKKNNNVIKNNNEINNKKVSINIDVDCSTRFKRYIFHQLEKKNYKF